MYVLGFISFITLGKYRVRHALGGSLTESDVDDMLMYGVLGVILGGRLGYVLFYKPEHYLAHPAEILQIWSGGMSFHGGVHGRLYGVPPFSWGRERLLPSGVCFLAP